MKLKVILQLNPVLPVDGEAGRNATVYNEVLHGWLDVVKAADEMGVWGASTIEHQLHSEGYEVGPNPGILNAWWTGHDPRSASNSPARHARRKSGRPRAGLEQSHATVSLRVTTVAAPCSSVQVNTTSPVSTARVWNA